jgi:hypothetical protein
MREIYTNWNFGDPLKYTFCGPKGTIDSSPYNFDYEEFSKENNELEAILKEFNIGGPSRFRTRLCFSCGKRKNLKKFPHSTADFCSKCRK